MRIKLNGKSGYCDNWLVIKDQINWHIEFYDNLHEETIICHPNQNNADIYSTIDMDGFGGRWLDMDIQQLKNYLQQILNTPLFKEISQYDI